MTSNYKIKRKTFVFLMIFAALMIGIAAAILHTGEVKQKDTLVLLTFGINLVLCFAMLIKAVISQAYSFDMMFWLFGLFFFGIAPTLQYITNTYAWNLIPQSSEVLRTNLYVLLWLACYLLGKSINRSIKITGNRTKSELSPQYTYKVSERALNFLLVISILITVYFIYTVGFANLFARGSNKNENLDGPMALIVQHGFRNIVLFTLVLSILHAKSRGRIGYEPIVAVICCLISCAPTGMARYMMASIYGGLLILLFANGSKKHWITFVIITGVVIIFPAINIFRRLSWLSTDNILESIIGSIQSTYLSGDYDAHQMFISVQRWIEQDGFQNGRQFVGALLFFVPRSLWPSKPLGTGRTAFEMTNQHNYTNVSAPLVSEGWVNFGVIGIIAFGIILGYVVKRVDSKYWREADQHSLIRVVYPSLMFMFFFMQRGDLMSTWSYLFAQLVMGIIVQKFAVKKGTQIDC